MSYRRWLIDVESGHRRRWAITVWLLLFAARPTHFLNISGIICLFQLFAGSYLFHNDNEAEAVKKSLL